MANFAPKITRGGMGKKAGCVTITTGSDFMWGQKKEFGGRKIKFVVCTIKNGIQIARAGRRGGVRGEGKARGGILLCTAQGAASKCLRAKDFVAFPGGGAKTRKWEGGRSIVLNGYSKKNRRVRRTRRAGKRRS